MKINIICCYILNMRIIPKIFSFFNKFIDYFILFFLYYNPGRSCLILS